MPLTGSDIKEQRLRMNMTQAAFAEKLGVSRELLVKMETGNREISKSTELLFRELVRGHKESETVSHETKTTPKPESLEVDWKALYLKEVEENKRLNKQRDEIFATSAALKEIQSTLSRKILVVQEFAWEIGAKLGLGQEALDAALDTIEGEVLSQRRRKGKSFGGDMKHKSEKKAIPEKKR